MNKNTGILLIIAVLAAIAIGIVILSGNDDNLETNQSNVTSQSEPTPATPDNSAQMQDMMENSDQTVDIVMSNFDFSEETINASPGDVITVNLSIDGGSHDFVIDELGVQSEVIGGSDTDTVTFTVPDDAAGQTYTFYCSIGNHRAQGMEGQLVISE